ncbi:hypothetical protein [Rhizobium sp. J15]|nr:hypothetical protein [Rhizobium sp. J15]
MSRSFRHGGLAMLSAANGPLLAVGAAGAAEVHVCNGMPVNREGERPD